MKTQGLPSGSPDELQARAIQHAAEGNLAEAAALLEQILAQSEGELVGLVCNDLGVIQQRSGNGPRAVELFRQGLEVSETNGRLWVNLAHALKSMGDVAEAVEAAGRAVTVSEDPDVLLRSADLLYRCDRFGACAAALQKAIQNGCDSASVWTNLGNALIAQGSYRDSQHAYERALSLDPACVPANANWLFGLHFDADLPPERIADAHMAWGDYMAEQIPRAYSFEEWDRSPTRPIQIGLLASDLRRHSIVYFLAAFLENWNAQDATLTIFSNVTSPDETTERLRATGHRWLDVSGRSCDECAALIHAERIDILIEVGGHTSPKTWEVLVRKPAPLQIAYLAYPDTTGLAAVDYLITDEIVDPPGASEHLYSERLLRLPGCCLCYLPPAESPDVTWQCGSEGVVFGSCAQRQKLSERTLSLWVSILRRTPGSRLLLKSRAWKDEALGNELREWFGFHGVGPDRIETVPHIGALRDHLDFYNRIDICLDTYPYSGITTTCEALWMGVPVIALPGRNQVSRICASVLHAAGVPELIAEGDTSYVARAVELAGDRARVRHYRTTLRGRMAASRLTDATAFSRVLQASLREVWQDWAGSKPARTTR